MIVRVLGATAVICALTACQPPLDVDEDKPLGYELRPTGIGVIGSTKEVSFGRVQPGAIVSLSKLAGQPIELRRNDTCGADQYIFRDGLTINVVRGSFDGWQSSDGRSSGLACPKA